MSLWRRWTLIGGLWGMVSLAAFLMAKGGYIPAGFPGFVVFFLALPTAVILAALLTLLAPIFVPLAFLFGGFFLLIPVGIRAVLSSIAGYLIGRYRRKKIWRVKMPLG